MTDNNSTNNTNNTAVKTDLSVGYSILIIFFFLFSVTWAIAGFIGFIMSIVCFFYNSTTDEKIIGLLLALFTGPFYWLYYILKSTYCTKNYYYYPQ